MPLLDVVKDVCSVVGVVQPTSVFSNIAGNRTMQEMLSLANEMAQRIAYDTRDWTLLKAKATYQGDGTTAAFKVPADFKRMLLSTEVWRSTSYIRPMRFVPDYDEWLNRRARNRWSPYGEWTNVAGQILIAPVMSSTVSAYHTYMVKNCINLAGGGVGPAFMADGDSFQLDERVLRLGMIWQWKAQKGSPYTEDMQTYGDALTYIMGHDVPMPILVGRYATSVSAKTAYPFPLPNPPS